MNIRIKSFKNEDNEFPLDHLVTPSIGLKIHYTDCTNIWEIVFINQAANNMTLKRKKTENDTEYLYLPTYIDNEWMVA